MSRLIVSERQNIVAIADAIRNKTGITNELTIGGMIDGINSISQSGESVDLDEEIEQQDTLISQIQTAIVGKTSNNLDTSDATASAEDIVEGKTAYVNGKKVTGVHTCSSGGVSVPELITVSWESVKDPAASNMEIATIGCRYIGINEDGAIATMMTSGKTGSIQCIPSVIEMWTELIHNDEYPRIDNISSDNDSSMNMDSRYVGHGGTDYSIIALPVIQSQHLTIECSHATGWW